MVRLETSFFRTSCREMEIGQRDSFDQVGIERHLFCDLRCKLVSRLIVSGCEVNNAREFIR